jgi:hypothetical protein
MRKFTVIAALTLSAGTIVGLTAAQAKVRAHALKPVQVDKKSGMGEYQVLEPVQFKRGEQIFTDADLPKQLATYLEPEEATRARERDAKRDQADAQALAEIKAKAKAYDDLQPELEALRAKAAAYDALPEDVRNPKA